MNIVMENLNKIQEKRTEKLRKHSLADNRVIIARFRIDTDCVYYRV